MTGMINQFERVRKCPHDQSTLEQIPGTWTMDQVYKTIDKTTTNAEWVPTGFMFTASLFKCGVCGYVEMVDQP